MAINHLVCIKYKPETTATEKAHLAAELIKLGQTCELDGKKYIVSVTGGKNNSQESFTKGFEHAFVMVFASVADRDYYTDIDASHGSFKVLVLPHVADILVVDFEEGVFTTGGKL